MNRFTFSAIGSVFGLLGVALGAFGAHGLKGRISPGDLEIYHTAASYQMVHALALIAVGLLPPGGTDRGRQLSGWAFILGICLFSGSLYLLVFTGQRWLGAVTPFGGVAFLVGWAGLAWRFLALRRMAGSRG